MPRKVSPNGERTKRQIASARHGRDRQYDPVECFVVVEGRRPNIAAQTVLAAGDLRPSQADAPDDHAERQCQQQEIDAGGPDSEQRKDSRHQHVAARIPNPRANTGDDPCDTM